MSELEAALNPLLELAIAEDFGPQGDVTSQAIFTTQVSTAVIISKAESVLYGLWIVPIVAKRIDERIEVEILAVDGSAVLPKQEICRLRGPTRSLLQIERIALNFLGYLSGIATTSARFAAAARLHGATIILDTRKTLPGYRRLAKAAVVAGGARNHRQGLYDLVMIKDNHIDAAGSIRAAVAAVRARWGQEYRIEVECRNLADVREALGLEVEIAMLDNMAAADCAAAVALRRAEFPQSTTVFEASGDMTLGRLAAYAGLGLEFISVGALTHSVVNANFSMKIEGAKRTNG